MRQFIFSIVALLSIGMISHAASLTNGRFFCDFEQTTGTSDWLFGQSLTEVWWGDDSPVHPNHWTIGNCQSSMGGSKALFLSSNGVDPIYSTANPGDIRMSNTGAYLHIENATPGSYQISFDCMCGGRENAHYLFSEVQDYYEDNIYPWRYDDDYNRPLGAYKQMVGNPSWTHYTYIADIPEGQPDFYVVFGWHMKGDDTVTTRISAIIDNVEIIRLGEHNCTDQPILLNHHREANDAVFRWSGYASEYEVEYFRADSTQLYFTETNITGHEYRIDCATVPEGAYTFRVRSICSNDTSAWSKLTPVLLYDISKHCMDYLDLDNEDVNPQNGSFGCPWCWGGKVDNGYYSRVSQHTVHFVPNDYDERTGYKLRTYPKGHPASVRLGNWGTDARAEAITYTMTITEDMKVMKLWYALVMQLPGHIESEQPRFTLEILDSIGNYFDEHCGVVDFTASANMDGWYTEPSHKMNDTTSVIWKDWTLIGINLRDYVGQTIQIRLTTKDCANTEHFGYAYFALECSRGDMEGIHCGEKPDHFTVEEGFNYRWYRKYDNPRVILGTDRTFSLSNSIDTATYCVDLIQLLDPSCYFTMEASSLGYVPNAKATSVWTPVNCQNYIQMVDSSSTQGVYWTSHGNKVVVTEEDGAKSYLWDFGIYGTSTERNPRLAIPDEGDTIHIVLHAMMENGLCDDVLAWDMIVPAVGLQQTMETYYICEGDSIEVHGVTYNQEGYYNLDSLTSWTGCDSLYTVAILYFKQDTIHYYDTICPSALPLQWRGLSLTESGDYMVRIPSINYDCDSVKDMLHLFVREELDIQLQDLTQTACAEIGIMEIPFVINRGDASSYSIFFDSLTLACGMQDIHNLPLVGTEITIPFPAGLRPGNFAGTLVIFNHDCENISVPLAMDIRYTADSLINQRWNDFLSVRKSASDYYGGFYDYQWYKDGQLMTGQTSSQLYVPEEGLDMQAGYAVELTRVADGVRVRSCEYFPTEQPTTVTLQVTPTSFSAAQRTPMTVYASETGDVTIFNHSGIVTQRVHANAGYNRLDSPAETGVYLVQITTESGQMYVQKIIVR